MVEDVESDAEITLRELTRAGLHVDFRRVETEGELARECGEFNPDVVLSDFALPNFDGLSALDRIRRTPYDLLFTDLVMPRLDGNQLLREAKRVRPALKVVIVTGCPTQSSAIDAINVGVDGYLIKPFQPADVLAAAAHAIGVVYQRSSTGKAEINGVPSSNG